MKRNLILTSMAFGAMLITAHKASAQNRNCGPHGTVVERLAERYGESRQVIAMASNNAVIEVFASDTTGTWTITMTQAGGLTCMMAAGEHYQLVAEALVNTDEGA